MFGALSLKTPHPHMLLLLPRFQLILAAVQGDATASSRTLWAAVFLVLSIAPLASHADEYTDVSQLLRSGKMAQALVQVDRHLATKPTDPQMRFFKGLIQRDANQIDAAIATFLALTNDFPELPEPHNNLAVLYATQNEFEKARVALEMAIRNNPNYATAHENLGDVHARLASLAYQKAGQLDASNRTVGPKLTVVLELLSLAAKIPSAGAASGAPATSAQK